MSYGNCPTCGAKGRMRERRPNGNDSCENGHIYPSKNAIPAGSDLVLPGHPKNCLSCGKDDNKTGAPCPTRKGCHYPNYDKWEPIGEIEPPGCGCHKCSSWAAVKIGAFCPDCGQDLK
jgi:hypothetical protein